MRSPVQIRKAALQAVLATAVGYFVYGEFPERSNGADCKSVGSAFEGSNPPLPNGT